MDSCLEGTDIITDSSSSYTGMDLKIHVVTKGNDDFLDLLGELAGWSEDEGLALTEFVVEFGKRANGEGGSFTLRV